MVSNDVTIEVEMIPVQKLSDYLSRGYYIDRIYSAYQKMPNTLVMVTKDKATGSLRLAPGLFLGQGSLVEADEP